MKLSDLLNKRIIVPQIIMWRPPSVIQADKDQASKRRYYGLK